MRSRTLACLIAAAVTLAACGGDDEAGGDGGRDAEYAEAMAASMADDETLPFDQKDIDCLSTEFVSALGGAERFEEQGIEPDDLGSDKGLSELGLDLGEQEAEGIAAAFGTCEVSLADLVLDEAGEEVPAEVRGCVEENLDEQVLADFFARVLVDDSAGDEPPEELLQPLLECF